MKILIICDDIAHHGEIVAQGLDFLSAEDGHDVTVAMDMAEYCFEATPLSGYDVVIVAKSIPMSKHNETSWLTESIEQQFVDYADNGGGLIFLHAGAVLCKNSPPIKAISGCAFIQHPAQCSVDYCITAIHPIVDGVTDFTEQDEHYFIEFRAHDATIFLKSRSNHGIQPAGYTRIHNGKGRVCVLTPGHNLSVFRNAQYKKILSNSVRWCAGQL